jgi:hypothetical protein
MRGAGAFANELFADELGVGPAVQRGQVGMQDNVVAHLLDPELAHIF